MHKNEKLIETFYTSFKNLDPKGMIDCYHRDIVFSDPGFSNLKGEEAGAMWEMLISLANGFELTFKDIEADDKLGSAYWEAKYNIPVLGTTVLNKINANFVFKDGKIIKHTDSFDMPAWLEMVFGPLVGPKIKNLSFVPTILQTSVGLQLKAFVKLRPILKQYLWRGKDM